MAQEADDAQRQAIKRERELRRRYRVGAAGAGPTPWDPAPRSGPEPPPAPFRPPVRPGDTGADDLRAALRQCRDRARRCAAGASFIDVLSRQGAPTADVSGLRAVSRAWEVPLRRALAAADRDAIELVRSTATFAGAALRASRREVTAAASSGGRRPPPADNDDDDDDDATMTTAGRRLRIRTPVSPLFGDRDGAGAAETDRFETDDDHDPTSAPPSDNDSDGDGPVPGPWRAAAGDPSAPAPPLHPAVVRAMEQLGLDPDDAAGGGGVGGAGTAAADNVDDAPSAANVPASVRAAREALNGDFSSLVVRSADAFHKVGQRSRDRLRGALEDRASRRVDAHVRRTGAAPVPGGSGREGHGSARGRLRPEEWELRAERARLRRTLERLDAHPWWSRLAAAAARAEPEAAGGWAAGGSRRESGAALSQLEGGTRGAAAIVSDNAGPGALSGPVRVALLLLLDGVERGETPTAVDLACLAVLLPRHYHADPAVQRLLVFLAAEAEAPVEEGEGNGGGDEPTARTSAPRGVRLRLGGFTGRVDLDDGGAPRGLLPSRAHLGCLLERLGLPTLGLVRREMDATRAAG